jgi:hypothetical protein
MLTHLIAVDYPRLLPVLSESLPLLLIGMERCWWCADMWSKYLSKCKDCPILDIWWGFWTCIFWCAGTPFWIYKKLRTNFSRRSLYTWTVMIAKKDVDCSFLWLRRWIVWCKSLANVSFTLFFWDKVSHIFKYHSIKEYH